MMNIEQWAELYASAEISKEKNPEYHATVKRIFMNGWSRAAMEFREHGWLSPSDAVDFLNWTLSEDCPYVILKDNHRHITDGHEVDTEALLRIYKNQKK
jgi:hypothetical protein